jgi:hypothetical protein
MKPATDARSKVCSSATSASKIFDKIKGIILARGGSLFCIPLPECRGSCVFYPIDFSIRE